MSEKKKFNVSTPSGFPEFPPAAEQIRQQWVEIIKKTFQQYGFIPIETPIVERTENLLGKGGNPKEIYVLERLHEESLDKEKAASRALRFDQTVPLALYIARHQNELVFPFRRMVVGPVFRGERAQKGRFRQFDQCDIDIIGAGSLPLTFDAEIPAIIIHIFEQLQIGDFVVRLNNRKILEGFFLSLGVDASRIRAVIHTVDDREKIPASEFQNRLSSLGISPESLSKVENFCRIFAPGESLSSSQWASWQAFCAHPLFQEGLEELKHVIEILSSLVDNPSRYAVDFSIARGLDYYTGTVYETKILAHPEFGSVCSGGRYEDLARIFTGKSFPGVGISIGLTRLFSQCLDAGLITPKAKTPTKVLLIPLTEEDLPYLFAFGKKLRKAGIPTEHALHTQKMGKKLQYADKLGIPYAVIAGESERESQSIQIKSLSEGTQKHFSLEEGLSYLQKHLTQ